MQLSSMDDLKTVHRSSISYRPIRPSDLEMLEKIHCDIFPIRDESEFFHNVVNGYDIMSWGAVDPSLSNGQNDELVGFVTARIVPAKESEIEDLLRFDFSKADQTLIYILTLGVVESYRNLEMSFQCMRRLHGFYFINGQHYDSFLFVYYLNGGQSPCSPLDLVVLIATYVKNGLKLVTAKLWNDEGKEISRWPNNEETCCLLTATEGKRILMAEDTRFQCV